MTTLKAFLLVLGISVGLAAFGQKDSVTRHDSDSMRGPYTVVNGDTMLHYRLDDVILNDMADSAARAKYRNLVYYIRKALPYAKMTAYRLRLMEQNLAKIEGKRERKKYIKASQESIKKEFTKDLENFPREQGLLLIKLIYRETGRSTYDILSDFTDPFTTFFFNTVAKVNGGDLKNTYDPIEDYQIEYIIKYYRLE